MFGSRSHLEDDFWAALALLRRPALLCSATGLSEDETARVGWLILVQREGRRGLAIRVRVIAAFPPLLALAGFPRLGRFGRLCGFGISLGSCESILKPVCYMLRKNQKIFR